MLEMREVQRAIKEIRLVRIECIRLRDRQTCADPIKSLLNFERLGTIMQQVMRACPNGMLFKRSSIYGPHNLDKLIWILPSEGVFIHDVTTTIESRQVTFWH